MEAETPGTGVFVPARRPAHAARRVRGAVRSARGPGTRCGGRAGGPGDRDRRTRRRRRHARHAHRQRRRLFLRRPRPGRVVGQAGARRSPHRRPRRARGSRRAGDARRSGRGGRSRRAPGSRAAARGTRRSGRRAAAAGSAAGARTRPGRRHADAVRGRRHRLDEWHRPRHDPGVRHQVLHARGALRRQLPAGLQSPGGPHHRRLDRGVPLRRVPDRAGEPGRQLSLAQRAGALPVDVRHVRRDHAAQRRQFGGRAVGPAGRLQVLLGGQRRLSLGREPRPQRRCRYLRLVRRPVQLLQLRQLDLPALVRLIQHAVVLQRPARAVVPDPDAEDRAVAHQRLAVVRQVQQPPGFRRSGTVDPQRPPQAGVQQLQRRPGQPRHRQRLSQQRRQSQRRRSGCRTRRRPSSTTAT